MLLVQASVGPSSIHGLGLIARELIPAGAAISSFEPRLDVELSQQELDGLPPPARRTFRYYSFRHIHSRNYVLSFDDDRFTNHSNDPNTNGRTALRAIAAGEEITYDYRRWDLDCEWKLAATPGSFERTLESGDREARLAVLRVIAQVGLADERAIPRMAEQLRDHQRDLRYYAAKALAKIGGAKIAPAAVQLSTALKDADRDVRYYASKCLSSIGPVAPAGVASELVAALGDADAKVRYYCVKALGTMGDGAAIERLRAIAPNDPDAEVRQAATRALARLEAAGLSN